MPCAHSFDCCAMPYARTPTFVRLQLLARRTGTIWPAHPKQIAGCVGEDVVVPGDLGVDVPDERRLTRCFQRISAPVNCSVAMNVANALVLGEARLHLSAVFCRPMTSSRSFEIFSLPAVDAAVGVDHVEVRVHAVGELRVLAVERVRLRRDDRDVDLGVGDARRLHRDVLRRGRPRRPSWPSSCRTSRRRRRRRRNCRTQPWRAPGPS